MNKIGKTTRIIDRIIQEFFNKGKAYIYEDRNNPDDTYLLRTKVVKRLELEHPNTKYTLNETTIDGIYCIILEKHNL